MDSVLYDWVHPKIALALFDRVVLVHTSTALRIDILISQSLCRFETY